MSDKFDTDLQDELRQAGASPADVSELSHLAYNIRKLSTRAASYESARTAKRPRLHFLRPYLVGAFVFALLMLPVLFSLTVQPTSWLFPVQKLADTAAISVHPRYRADVMMQRSEQVNSLVSAHADPHVILATLDDYTYQAKKYQALPHTNYPALEYCETNLKEAASHASPNIKRAIQNSLDSLET